MFVNTVMVLAKVKKKGPLVEAHAIVEPLLSPSFKLFEVLQVLQSITRNYKVLQDHYKLVGFVPKIS